MGTYPPYATQITLREAGIRVGTTRFFQARGMNTLGDIADHTANELMAKGVVNRLLEYIRRLLRSYGLSLRREEDRAHPTSTHTQKKVTPSQITLKQARFTSDAITYFQEKGIATLGDLTRYSASEFTSWGMRGRRIHFVRTCLKAHGLALKEEHATPSSTPVSSSSRTTPKKKKRTSPKIVYAPQDLPLERVLPRESWRHIPFFKQLGFTVLGDFTRYTARELVQKGITGRLLGGIRKHLRTHGLSLRVVERDPETLTLNEAGFRKGIVTFYAERGIHTLGDFMTHGIEEGQYSSHVRSRLLQYDLIAPEPSSHEGKHSGEQEQEEEALNTLTFPEIMPDGTRMSAADYLKKNEKLVYAYVHRSGVLRMRSTKTNAGFDPEDLYQEARLGFLIALSRFDPNKGGFPTYAWWWMKQRVFQFIKRNERIRLPIGVYDMVMSYIKKERELRLAGTRPTQAHILRELDIPASSHQTLLEGLSVFRSRVVSIQSEVRKGGNASTRYEDILGDETVGKGSDAINPTATVESKLRLQRLLERAHLGPREQDILLRRHGLNGYRPHTLGDVGYIMGISRERVRQIEEQIYERLRSVDDGGLE